MPFLDWDRHYRYKILARELREIQRPENNAYELRVEQERQVAVRERDALPTTNPFRRPDLRKPEKSDNQFIHGGTSTSLKSPGSVGACRNRDSQGRLLAGTAVGQVLLDAATLAMEMSTYRDRVLLQRYARSNGDMSYRQPFVRQDPQAHRFSNDDILHRATVSRTHLNNVKISGTMPSQQEARMLMLGDLWLWVLDEHTIVTCLAPRIGEDTSSDSRDLQREIHQVLSDQLRHGLGLNIENILAVILDVCLGTMFKGLPKDFHDVDLTGIIENEIAGLVRSKLLFISSF